MSERANRISWFTTTCLSLDNHCGCDQLVNADWRSAFHRCIEAGLSQLDVRTEILTTPTQASLCTGRGVTREFKLSVVLVYHSAVGEFGWEALERPYESAKGKIPSS